MHDVTSATANSLQLERKRLPYGTRPFLLLRRVWLARLDRELIRKERPHIVEL